MINKAVDKVKKIKLPLAGRIWNSDVLLAMALNFIFLLSILIFCDIKYEVSDDFVMAAIMSGAYGEAPNPHMIFVNIIWGYMMLPFYYLFPGVSWYLIFQLLLCFCSFTLVSYMLLKKLNRPMAVMLIIMLLTFFGDDVYILVQFTKTAMLAVMGGGIVFTWALFHGKSKKTVLISAFVCLAGTLVRFSTIYMAGGFLCFILLTEFVALFSKKTELKEKIKKAARIALPGILLIVTAFGLKKADAYIYDMDEEYAYFRDYSSARAKIVDASDYGYGAYAEELQKIGITENDYKLMRTWNFADNEVFTLETMQKTGEIIENYKKNVEISKEAILEKIQVRGITGYQSFLGCAILFIIAIIFQKRYLWHDFVTAMIGFLYILYFFVIERVVYRIEYSVLLGVFLGILYFGKDFQVSKKENHLEFCRICVILITIFMFMELPLYLPDRSYQEVSGEDRKNYIDDVFFESWNYDARKYRKPVNKGKQENGLLEELQTNKENFYFLDFQTTMQTLYYEWNPFEALPVQYFDNSLYFASIMTNFPDGLERLEKYHIERPLEALLKENVYLVDSDERTLNNKIQYLEEHGYSDIQTELYKETAGYQIWRIYEKNKKGKTND